MFLSRLVYFSRPVTLGDGDLEGILSRAYANNYLLNVTGALFYNAGYFVQVLEGARGALTRLFVTIASDGRHKDVNLIEFASVTERVFPDWDMRYIGTGAPQERVIKKYMPNGFDPTVICDSTVMVRMLKELSEAAPHCAAEPRR